jgi:hypothetical protein
MKETAVSVKRSMIIAHNTRGLATIFCNQNKLISLMHGLTCSQDPAELHLLTAAVGKDAPRLSR